MTIDWEKIRGPLPKRSMNARSTAALLDNPGCLRRAVLDTAQIDTAKMADHLGQPVPFGQSPFAIGQGNRFEARVKANHYAELKRVLAEVGIVLPPSLTTVSIRGGFDNEARVADTRGALEAIATGESTAVNVIDKGMTKLLVGDNPVYLEQDALAFRHGEKLHICEIKGFPLVDGTAEPQKVGAAARQSAVYLASIEDTLGELGVDPTVVSYDVVLICPRNYTIQPTARKINVGREVRALRRQLRKREQIDSRLVNLDLTGLTEETRDEAAHSTALVEALEFRYQPACIGTCDLARQCRSEAQDTGSPCTLGDEAANLLAATSTLETAKSLSNGANPEPNNIEVAAALVQARKAQIALTTDPGDPE